MNIRLCLSLLFGACLLFLPGGRLLACGNEEAKGVGKTMLSQSADDHCTTLRDDCVDAHPGRDCPPDTDGCGHCHCPGCGAGASMVYAGFFKNAFSALPLSNWSCERQPACFCYDVPSTSAHMSALFQPPRV